MAWYAIRTVYALGTNAEGAHVFEERVVAFEAPDWDRAHSKAKEESAAYAAALGAEPHPDRVGYEQDGSALIDGYELWSILMTSHLRLDEFYVARYSAYE
ncbi:MAG: hypothetical protein KA144_06340 [Xanthomonadaceae bacterium]|nr:hypothetical protein [Xanthomonadaceae bacterium]